VKQLFGILTSISLLWLLTACQSFQPVNLTATAVRTPTLTETVVVSPTFNAQSTPTMVLQKTATIQPTNSIVPNTASPKITEMVSNDITICSPLLHETITSIAEIIGDPYNPPPPGRDERHHGVDFSYYHHGERDTIEGEGVQAILTGTVAAVVNDRLPYGNMVIIESPVSSLPAELASFLEMGKGESLFHLYAHMEAAPLIQIDEAIECGQALGTVGMTGYNIVNPHLHLEVRVGPAGTRFPGMAYYTTSATTEEMDNYVRWRTSGEFRHFDPMTLFSWFLDH
jgi:murein DD-endopeptidase MepM/ murein hydrolase activator NlpD